MYICICMSIYMRAPNARRGLLARLQRAPSGCCWRRTPRCLRLLGLPRLLRLLPHGETPLGIRSRVQSHHSHPTRGCSPRNPTRPTPRTLHPTPYTLHPTLYTLHTKPYTEWSACCGPLVRTFGGFVFLHVRRPALCRRGGHGGCGGRLRRFSNPKP